MCLWEINDIYLSEVKAEQILYVSVFFEDYSASLRAWSEVMFAT